MKRYLFAVATCMSAIVLSGCGGDEAGDNDTAFEGSELEKYVAENPSPVITEADIKAAQKAELEAMKE